VKLTERLKCACGRLSMAERERQKSCCWSVTSLRYFSCTISARHPQLSSLFTNLGT
jgi:hypothetical protein